MEASVVIATLVLLRPRQEASDKGLWYRSTKGDRMELERRRL